MGGKKSGMGTSLPKQRLKMGVNGQNSKKRCNCQNNGKNSGGVIKKQNAPKKGLEFTMFFDKESADLGNGVRLGGNCTNHPEGKVERRGDSINYHRKCIGCKKKKLAPVKGG